MPKFMFRYKDRKKEIEVHLEDYSLEDQRLILDDFLPRIFPTNHQSNSRDGIFRRFFRLIKRGIVRIFFRKRVEYSGNKSTIKYQVRYVCPKCRDKRTLFVDPGTTEIQCSFCSQPMKVRSATKQGLPHRDSWGNHLIAGDFKREDKWKEQVQQETNNAS